MPGDAVPDLLRKMKRARIVRHAPARGARAWQRMLSGRRLDLLDPSPLDIEIEDIAHGLARVARWNGQTSGAHAFSVAEHSLLVERIASELEPKLGRDFRLAALIHDAPEYVIGDLISPFKAALSLDYRAFEAKLLSAIHVRFGLPAELPDNVVKSIKRADRIAAYYEATGLAGFSRAEAGKFFGQPRGLSAPLVQRLSRLDPLPTSRVEVEFLKKFNALHR
jgi:5'-deoxynucleotidase YfbR-like HD superfamily hydrolase